MDGNNDLIINQYTFTKLIGWSLCGRQIKNLSVIYKFEVKFISGRLKRKYY